MPRKGTIEELGARQRERLLETLRARFETNAERHEGIQWTNVQARVVAKPDKLWSLGEMEWTGGEPDVVGQDRRTSVCGQGVPLLAQGVASWETRPRTPGDARELRS